MEKLNLGSFKNSSEWYEVQRKIKDKQRDMKRFEEMANKKYTKSNSISEKNNLQRQYKEILNRYSKEIIELNRKAYIKWATRILSIWKKKQIALLKEKFYKLIPKEPYYIIGANKKKVYIRPEQAKQQADELVNAIVNAVYDKLKEGIDKYGRLPSGGNWGNYRALAGHKGEVQCNEWSSIIEKSCFNIILSYVKKDKNTFQMIWKNVSRIIYIRGEHNWMEFKRIGDNKIVIIDPWPSGGRKIYSKKTYKNREGSPLTTYPEYP